MKSFQTRKEQNYTAVNNIRNPFRLEIETKAIKDKIRRDIKNYFQHKEEKNHDKHGTIIRT